ncbi:MAG TPA: TIGR02996 domain-containing protein [Kofleriaceae bacterium]|nr:TIGR02996 domain-containing protein [Kofleriaceae bacterium]
MLFISVDAPDEHRVFSFARDVIIVGSDPSADLVLDKPQIAARHIQIEHAAGELRVSDLRSRGPKRVDRVEPGDVLRVGGVDLRISLQPLVPEAVDDPTERQLIDAIRARPDDTATREVYADWLDEHGHAARAEFLRAQLAAGAARTAADPAFVEAAAILKHRAPEVGEGWRASVAMAFVEQCPQNPSDHPRWRRRQQLGMELVCPARWDKLEPTDREGVRACGACQREVTYCTTVAQARSIALAGGCVAVDIAASRRPHDLEPEMVVGRPAPPLARYGRNQR